jgi:2-keto-3-deoxy-L-rhamnonate aldolase RhmA
LSINLKDKLISNELTIGSWLTLPSMAIAEIMCNAGFDWLVVDLEHTTISLEQAGEMIRTIELSGVSSLVRLTSNDENQIKRVMDAGAQGIVVPMVKGAADARRAVAATRYPPLGTRGVGLARAQEYGAKFEEYLAWQSDINLGPVVVVQIEHVDAVANLKEILNVDGIDAFIIGPYDLSCSMGIPGEFDNSEFIQTINKIIQIGSELNIVGGLHVVEPDKQKLNNAIIEGYNFIAYSVDIRMIDVAARVGIAEFKKLKK